MTKEYTGGSVSYYRVKITHPTTKDAQPYEAECNDIIEALGMTYAEGNAFKAIWRKCAARTLGISKAGYSDGLYDAEKVEFFGLRMVEQEKAARESDRMYDQIRKHGAQSLDLPREEVGVDTEWNAERVLTVASSHGDGEHYAVVLTTKDQEA